MAFAAATHSRDLTDEQWDLIGRFLPEPVRRADGRGRPWRENRAVLNGILWVLRTGAPWADLPDRYPSYQTCHRRFAVGPPRRAAEHPRSPRSGTARPRLSGSAGSVHRWELRASQAGRRSRRQDEAWQGVEDHGNRRSSGLPVAVHVESATPHEVTLVQATLAQRFVNQLPVRLIGDNAHESDRLDAELARRGVGTDRATPEDPDTADARWSPAASLPTAVEDRAALRMAPELSANHRAL